MTAEDLIQQLGEFSTLAAEGNESAAKVIAWFDDVSDQAGLTSTYPQDLDAEGIQELMNEAGRTATLFFGARLMRWVVDHPGNLPSHFTFHVGVHFEEL